MDRGNLCQLVQNGLAVDIPAVQDHLAARQLLPHLRPDQAVGVGNDGDSVYIV